MTMIPDHLPILSSGKQPPGSGQVCAEQAVNWLVSGRLDLGDETDRPSCVQPVLNGLAIWVNDALPDARRHEMWPIILRQPGTAHPEMEPELSSRLAGHLCRYVAANMPQGTDGRVTGALEAAAVCLLDPSEANRAKAAEAAKAPGAAWAAGAAEAAQAAQAAWAAKAAGAAWAAGAARAAWAAWVAGAAGAARAATNLLASLSEAQDECERLTGHVPPEPDTGRIERLGELVGVTG